MTKEDFDSYVVSEKQVMDRAKEIISFIINHTKPETEVWEYRYMSIEENKITFEMSGGPHIEKGNFPIEWLWTNEWEKQFSPKEEESIVKNESV